MQNNSRAVPAQPKDTKRVVPALPRRSLPCPGAPKGHAQQLLGVTVFTFTLTLTLTAHL